MPRGSSGAHTINRLTVTFIKRAKGPRHADGGGLYLVVDPSGARRFIYRGWMMREGRKVRTDIGHFPEVHAVWPNSRVGDALTAAREKARLIRAQVRMGQDPVASRGGDRVPSFETAATEYHTLQADSWRNPKHRAQWLSTLRTYAFPKIGAMPVNTITSADLLGVLSPIWLSKEETAGRVGQRINSTLDWCKARNWRAEGGPLKELLKVLPRQKAVPKHHAAMPYAEIPAFLRRLKTWESEDVTKAALEFCLLTATRTTETLKAHWSEIDLGAATWTIPGARMKNKKRPHTVPLVPRALAILSAMKKAHSGKEDLVFESKPGRSLSQMALLMVMRRMETGATVHGFRSSFRDWAGEKTNFPREIAEAALAHSVEGGKTEAAYARSDLLEKRRKLMAQWSTHCTGGADVVKLRKVS